MAPTDNIKGVVNNIENNSSSSKESKEYAKKILDAATKKGIESSTLNMDAKAQLDFLLKDMTIDPEFATTQIADSISPSSSSHEETTIQTPSNDTSSTSNSNGYSEGYISPEIQDDKVAAEKVEQMRNQGWTDLYVIAKMISLGYIPKLHDGKYHSGFKGQKIGYIKENIGYLLVGGPLTNGTINNELFRKWQEKANKVVLEILFNEESQTKILLGQVQNTSLEGQDRTNLNNRLVSLERIKTALQSGDTADIRIAMADYKQIAETSGVKIKDLFKKEDFKTLRAKNEAEINKSVSDKIEKSKENTEKAKADIKKSINTPLDSEIKTIDTEIKKLRDADIANKTNIETSIEDLEEKKIEIEAQIKKEEKLLTKENNYLKTLKEDLRIAQGKKPINQEIIDSLNADIKETRDKILTHEDKISTHEDKITEHDNSIKTKKKEIKQLGNNNNTEELNKKRALLTEMKKDISSGNMKSFRNNMIEFEGVNEGNKISGIRDFQLSYLEADHTKKIDKKEKNLRDKKITEKDQEIKQKIQTRKENVPQKEIDRINREIGETEKQMTKLRQEAETKLQQFDKIGKINPERIPALKKEAERLVENYNKQVSKLETAGIENVRGLNTEQLKGVTQDSKLLQNISKANGGLDKLSSGKGGKLLGVGAMMIVGGGAYEALKKDGLSQETALNATDIGIGMIPIAGGVYDIGMAIHGEDLNGKTMETNERLMRAGFGVVGLIPGLGTVVKWRAASGKIAKTAEGTSKIMRHGETIIQGGHLAGKTMSLGALGMTVGFTTYEMLPSNEK